MGGGGNGAKEKLLRFPVPVVQWVDSTTHRINLCLCPVDNAIILVSLILYIYWIVSSIFLTTGARSSEFATSRWGLIKMTSNHPDHFYGVP